MAKNTSVAIGDHFQRFIEQQLKRGRFGSTSEVIRAGLRLLEEREAKHDALRVAVQEGIDSGPAEEFDFDDFINRKLEQAKDVQTQSSSQGKKRSR
jgi:antitoxin ParD1/3/4